MRGAAGEQAAHGLDQASDRIRDRDAVDPALEERERHVDRREEEDQENGRLHDRPRLDGLEAHGDAARPEQEGGVDEIASVYRPTRSTPPPLIRIPARTATPVTITAVRIQRTSAPIA